MPPEDEPEGENRRLRLQAKRHAAARHVSSPADRRIVDWRERYEVEARKASEALSPLGEAELLDRVRAGRIDPYFAIWRAIGRKGTVDRAAPVLWAFLADHPGEVWMLHRYHCAAALFRLLGLDDPAGENPLRKRVQWDHEGEDARQAALLELRTLLDDRRTTAP